MAQDQVKAAGRTLDLFETFATARGPLSLTELSQRIGIPVSSCHALVRTLQNRGYVYVLEERKRIYPTKRLAALAEAIGRLASLVLRLPSPLTPGARLGELVSQLRGIGGSRAVGFGPEQVRSLPDAVGKALDEHLDGHPSLQPHPMQLPLLHGAASAAPTPAPMATGAYNNGHTNGNGNGHGYTNGHGLANLTTYKMTGNICPECGSSTLVYEEGCKKCVSCGHSEC